MDQRVDFITLATADLDAARTFYLEGLGWVPSLDVPGEIIFFQVGHGVMLGLYEAAKFVQDLGGPSQPPPPISGVTLSHNVASAEAVDRVFSSVVRAGAIIVKPPQAASFGGYHGHFADPNGVVWEVAYNPGWRVHASGTVRLDSTEG